MYGGVSGKGGKRVETPGEIVGSRRKVEWRREEPSGKKEENTGHQRKPR
jgi:hypothetical protein